jgi:stage II sporulation protein R
MLNFLNVKSSEKKSKNKSNKDLILENKKKKNKLLIMPNIRSNTFLMFAFCLILLNVYFVINIYNTKNYRNNFLRLHIVANSNDINDQIIKLKISNKIQNYIDDLKSKSNYKNENENEISNLTKEDYLNLIKNNSSDILKIANETLKNENINYESKMNVGKIKYTEKENLNLDMESGVYDSVQIVLGKGEGKNFWTLISPNEENLNKIKEFNTILPGIKNIFNDTSILDNTNKINIENENDNDNESEIKFKSIEILKELTTKL